MRYTHAIAGLRRKRAYLMGEIEQAKRGIAKLRDQLAAVGATLRLFHPEADPNHIAPIRPFKANNVWFRRGEQTRLTLEALREAGKPLPLPAIADYVMRAKGVPREDWEVWVRGRNHVRIALRRLAERGQVRKIIEEPDTWWQLAG
jgi:hypothetical protein